ncbi:hypothetical protein DB347_02145 [Opitutaceae bacterium EW11]|nr:hypothetical protein DB347_02145 [Opitutaceae bacterium EW11]
MNELILVQDGDRAVEIRQRAGGLLLRYVFQPDTPRSEAPRPYAHPVCSLSGEVLTCFRPNDHPWHHGLSFTVNQVSGHNFWGGPTYYRDLGYRWMNDQGRQRHVSWGEMSPSRLQHTVAWEVGEKGQVLLDEKREIGMRLIDANSWEMTWRTLLKNVSGRPLVLGNYFSSQGLKGSHYTGLQFRGTRELLDEHGDARIGIFSQDGGSGEAEVHGAASNWMEWRTQKDTSLRRVAIRFLSRDPVHWFVRRHNPLAAFPFQYERDLLLAPDAELPIEHRLTFTDTP